MKMMIKINKKYKKKFISLVLNKVDLNKVINLHKEILITGKKLVCRKLLIILLLVRKMIDSNNNHMK
jgi:hypothetical protein